MATGVTPAELTEALQLTLRVLRHATQLLEGLLSVQIALTPSAPTPPSVSVVTLPEHGCSLAEIEKLALEQALTRTGSQHGAAKLLGISPRVMNYKINTVHKLTTGRRRKDAV